MKFLCDRCKTRYSIGDDRVRGKILKIRCKNCANVITVREGMTDVDASEAPGQRRQKATTMAPAIESSTPANGALGSAFASAMTTKPPPALEEEWYVSNDGDQEGPFSLAEAQRWVAGKLFDADLHCWSEGFDDWLPIDKVSHFRGLRKRPTPPTAPPPVPRVGGGPSRSLGQQVEEEPKPLFAATMASLEKTAPTSGSPGMKMPTIGNMRPSATPPTGQPVVPFQAKTNGSAIKAPSHPARAPTVSGPGVAAQPPTFDVGDSATQIQPQPFQEEVSTLGEPVAAATKRTSTVEPLPAPSPAGAGHVNDDDDSLAIGEVSRVVNLADLMRNAPRAKGGGVGRRTGPGAALVGRSTGANASLNTPPPDPTALDANGLPVALDPSGTAGETGLDLAAQTTPAASHRRGTIALLGVAAVLLLGVAGAVVLFVLKGGDDTQLGLRGGGVIDTTRPDDILHKGTGDPDSKSDDPSMPPKIKTTRPTTRPVIPTRPIETNPNLMALRPDEVEAEAGKRSTGTQRCYIRSQKGADAILIGDVKKIAVTLTVDKDGNVTDVQLSEHSTDSLGKCLVSSIRTWKFRQSLAGITAKITMVFQSG